MPIDIEASTIISAVRAKARSLKIHSCFLDKDFEDIEAALFVHLWKTGLTLPPDRFADMPLIHTILNRKGVDMLRHQMSQKELARRETESLNAATDTDEDGYARTLANTLPSRAPSIVDEVAFLIDFDKRLSALPSNLHAIVEKILHGRSHADIAREMGISRDRFHRRYATLIQKMLFPEWYARIKKTCHASKTKSIP